MSETISTMNDGAATERVSTRVVTELANRKNVDPVDLPPLYPEVDLDALDSLFHPSDTGAVSAIDRVTFEVLGCEVVVEGPSRITVQSTATETEPRLVK